MEDIIQVMCPEHNSLVQFFDLAKGIPIGKRALCIKCFLDKPTAIAGEGIEKWNNLKKSQTKAINLQREHLLEWLKKQQKNAISFRKLIDSSLQRTVSLLEDIEKLFQKTVSQSLAEIKDFDKNITLSQLQKMASFISEDQINQETSISQFSSLDEFLPDFEKQIKNLEAQNQELLNYLEKEKQKLIDSIQLAQCSEGIKIIIKGIQCRKNGNHQEAINSFDQVILRYPDNSQAHFFKGTTYNIKGDSLISLQQYEQALLSLNQALEIQPNSYQYHDLTSFILFKLCRLDEALEHAIMMININPKNKDGFIAKGSILKDLNRLQEAVQFLDEAIKNFPECYDFYFLKGECLMVLNKNLEALQCFNQVLKGDPQHQDSLANKCKLLVLLKRNQEAVDFCEQVQAMNLTNASLLVNQGAVFLILGFALIELKRLNEAIISSDLAIKLEPLNPKPLNNKGYALMQLSRYEEAIKCFDEAINLDVQNPNPYNNKGEALLKQNKIVEAARCFDQAIRLNPNYWEAFQNLGMALLEQKQYEDALVHLNRAITLAPNEWSLYYNKGNILCELGRVNEAVKSYETSLEKGNPETDLIKIIIISLNEINY